MNAPTPNIGKLCLQISNERLYITLLIKAAILYLMGVKVAIGAFALTPRKMNIERERG
jgi:hypothetical protein